jgi:hypothetical protein
MIILLWDLPPLRHGDTSDCDTKALKDTTQTNGECQGIVPCDMSPNDVRPLDINRVNSS